MVNFNMKHWKVKVKHDNGTKIVTVMSEKRPKVGAFGSIFGMGNVEIVEVLDED